MERTTIKEAKEIFGKNFLGPEELKSLFGEMGLKVNFDNVTSVPFSKEQLINSAKDGYILGYAIDKVGDTYLNIKLFRDIFGINPEKEPCFYNQDWYLAEDFIQTPLVAGWF